MKTPRLLDDAGATGNNGLCLCADCMRRGGKARRLAVLRQLIELRRLRAKIGRVRAVGRQLPRRRRFTWRVTPARVQ